MKKAEKRELHDKIDGNQVVWFIQFSIKSLHPEWFGG
jgi:hypothetical protein